MAAEISAQGQQSSTTTTLAPVADSDEDCAAVHAFVVNPFGNASRLLQITLSTITFILLFHLVRAKWRHGNVAFHGNFNLLFFNSIAVWAIFCFASIVLQLRYIFLAFLHATDCYQQLTPLWFAIVTRTPAYIQFLALPLLHFSIVCERLRATLFVRVYEREGTKFGLFELALIWTLVGIFIGYVAITVLVEQCWNFQQRFVYATLISNYNANLVLQLHYAILLLVLTTSGIDCWMAQRNWKQQSSNLANSLQYTLSHKYQVNENLLSIRLMLPLDTSFAVIFIIYLTASIYIRSIREQLSTATFLIIFDWILCLNMVHGIISIWLYTRIIREFRAKRVKIVEVQPWKKTNDADTHFNQLQSQWSTGLSIWAEKLANKQRMATAKISIQ